MSHLRLIGVIAALVVILCLGLWAKSCWTAHKAKLNEKQIQQAKEAIAEHNDEKLKEVFAQADAKQAVIDQTISNSEADTQKATVEAKQKYDAMSNEQLAQELEERSR